MCVCSLRYQACNFHAPYFIVICGLSGSTIYLLTPWCRVLLEQLTGLQLVKKFPAFHGTRKFITALTSVRHLSLSWASPFQSIYPHPTFWRPIPILSTHLRLGLPSGLFPSGFPTKTLYSLLSSPIRATCPAHLILLDFITRTILGEEYKSFSSSLCYARGPYFIVICDLSGSTIFYCHLWPVWLYHILLSSVACLALPYFIVICGLSGSTIFFYVISRTARFSEKGY